MQEHISILDGEATAHYKTSRSLMPEEFAKVVPTEHSRMFHLIFRYRVPHKLPRKLALAFVEKFPSVFICNENLEPLGANDDLEDMKFMDLKRLMIRMVWADRNDSPGQDELEMTKNGLIEYIRELRDSGVEPLTEEELIAHREKRKTARKKAEKKVKENAVL